MEDARLGAERAIERRDHAGRHGVREPEGVADRDHAARRPSGRSSLRARIQGSVSCVSSAQHGEVVVRVGADELRVELRGRRRGSRGCGLACPTTCSLVSTWRSRVDHDARAEALAASGARAARRSRGRTSRRSGSLPERRNGLRPSSRCSVVMFTTDGPTRCTTAHRHGASQEGIRRRRASGEQYEPGGDRCEALGLQAHSTVPVARPAVHGVPCDSRPGSRS